MTMQWGLQSPNYITVADIVEQVRMKVSDSLVNKFSDQEIVTAVTEGIQLLWHSMVLHHSSVTQKYKEYNVYGTALLPDDFYSLESLESCNIVTPRIIGNYIVGKGRVYLCYNFSPKTVTRLDDTVEVPQSLTRDLVAIVSNLVVSNIDGAQQRADETAQRVSQTREIARIPDVVAFP